jgi:hypothetical protein
MIYKANEAHQNLPNYLPPYLCNIRGVKLTTDLHQGEKCVKLHAYSPTTVQGVQAQRQIYCTSCFFESSHNEMAQHPIVIQMNN